MRQYNLVHIRRVVSEVISDNPCPNVAYYSFPVLNIFALILGLVSLYSNKQDNYAELHKKIVYKNISRPIVTKTIIS